MDTLADAVESRLRQDEASVDGVLCWDFFDFLDKAAAQRVAKHLVKMVETGRRDHGVLLHLRRRARAASPSTRSSTTSRCGTGSIPASVDRSCALHNREIIKMFDGSTVAESFLLKNNSREILLRKK